MGRYWKKHPIKDLETLLSEFDAAGWRILDPPKYYKVYCACPEQHKRTVHLTPSNPQYTLDTRKWLQRQSCYKEAKGRS